MGILRQLRKVVGMENEDEDALKWLTRARRIASSSSSFSSTVNKIEKCTIRRSLMKEKKPEKERGPVFESVTEFARNIPNNLSTSTTEEKNFPIEMNQTINSQKNQVYQSIPMKTIIIEDKTKL